MPLIFIHVFQWLLLYSMSKWARKWNMSSSNWLYFQSALAPTFSRLLVSDVPVHHYSVHLQHAWDRILNNLLHSITRQYWQFILPETFKDWLIIFGDFTLQRFQNVPSILFRWCGCDSTLCCSYSYIFSQTFCKHALYQFNTYLKT